jgi:hypothetical protein
VTLDLLDFHVVQIMAVSFDRFFNHQLIVAFMECLRNKIADNQEQ